MNKTLRLGFAVLALGALVAVAQTSNANRGQERPTLWADCEMYEAVVAPNEFGPDQGPFDELYTGGNGFMAGVPLISETKPGDRDYNGGRWHVNTLKAGVDPNKYSNACTVEDLDLNDFESTDNYFGCPMIPKR